MSAPKTTQLHGEQIPVLRRGTIVKVGRTVDAIEAGTEGRIEDVRFHGRGVQYLIDNGSLQQWVGGRYVSKVPAKRKPRGKAKAA